MFGTFRLTLAALVIWDHFYGALFAGPMAVFGFYCLSGYLMTAIINGPYADGLSGFARFLWNRVLRIYPTYLAMVFFVAAAVLTWPAVAARFSPELFEPKYLVPSLTIIGLFPKEPTFSTPAWTLHVELLHYIAIGALFGRSRMATVAWFVASLVLVIFGTNLGGIPVQWFYFSPIGSSIAFATGAMIWHFRNHLPSSRTWLAIVSVAAFVIVARLMTVPSGFSWGLHTGLAIAALAIIGLRDLPSSRTDAFLGELSYPIYLLHGPAARIAGGILGGSGDLFETIGLMMAIALSLVAVIYIERPLRAARSAVRGAMGGELG